MNLKNDRKGFGRTAFLLLTAFVIFVLLIYAISLISPRIAVLTENFVALPIRRIVAILSLSPFVPLPLTELMLLTLPIALPLLLCSMSKMDRGRAALMPVIIIEILSILYSATIAIPTLSRVKMSHGVIDIAENDYISASAALAADLRAFDLSDEYSFSKICDTATDAVVKYAEKCGMPRVSSTVKPSLISEILCGAGILAYYSFITTEISVNVYQPKYMLAFTVAHEEAHFMGITREDEANLFAYAALSESDDSYLRYSAALRGFEYLASSVYGISPAKYSEVYSSLTDNAKADLVESRKFSEGMSCGFFGKISAAANDALISVRDSRGKESYSDTATLIVEYLLCN